MSESERYPAQVFWSDEDEGFIAIAPDLPGCSAWGETREQAAAELQEAVAAWIDAQRAAGNPIPAPSIPAAASSYSGRVLLRLPKSLHAKLARDADLDGVSLNTHLVNVLSSAGLRVSHSGPSAAIGQGKTQESHINAAVQVFSDVVTSFALTTAEYRIPAANAVILGTDHFLRADSGHTRSVHRAPTTGVRWFTQPAEGNC